MRIPFWARCVFMLVATAVTCVALSFLISILPVHEEDGRCVQAAAAVTRSYQRAVSEVRTIARQLDRIEAALAIGGEQPVLPGAPRCVVLRSVGKRLCYHDLARKLKVGEVR